MKERLGQVGAGTQRRETIVGALVVALFALIFLARPIAEIGAGEFGPADCSKLFALTRVGDDARPANPELLRTWTTHQAWQRMSADRIAYGGLPTWNGFNGGGVPHLANPQTAVFSPFSWGFYVLDPAWAVLLASLAKLFVAGFATYLFLRELGLRFAAGISGAIVFMFSGAEITTLLSPASSTVILLPLGLFFAERMRRIVESAIEARRAGRPEWMPLARNSIWFTLAIAISFCGGAVDTFLFCAIAVGTWIALQLGRLAWRERGDASARRETTRAALHLVGIGVLAACVCAIQALPYLEYLRNARLAPTTTGDFALPAWPLFFFPGLFGTPAEPTWIAGAFEPSGFATTAACATGALPLLLAIFGLSSRSRGGTAWFFFALAAGGLLVGGGALGMGLFQGLFPLQHEPVVQRALVLFPFAVAALAALAVDRVERGGRFATPPVAVMLFGTGAAIILLARAIAQRHFDATLADPRVAGEHALRVIASAAHVDFVVATFLLGLAAFAVASTLPAGNKRTALLLALAPIVYAQVSKPFADYIPVTPSDSVLPYTTSLTQRSGYAGARATLVLGDVDVPPSVNAVYGLRSLAVNDPFHVRRFDQLFEASFAPRGEFDLVSHADRHALDLFGVQCVLDPDGWVDVDTEFGGSPAQRSAQRHTADIAANSSVSQYFTPPADGLRCVRFAWVTHGLPNARSFSVTIDDLDTGTRLVEQVFGPWSVRPAGRDIVDCKVPFPREAKVMGHALRLRVSSLDDAVSRASYALVCRTDLFDRGPNWHATQGETVLEGCLDFDLSYAFDDFERAGRAGPFDVFFVKNGVPRFRTLSSARVVDDDASSFAAVMALDFDPRTEVVLEAAPRELARSAAPGDEQGAVVEVLDDLDGHVRLVVKRKTSGFVVTPIAWYPGWRVKLNGESARPLCANYAFTAVAVPAGESLVELEYAPKSVHHGLILSLFGLISLFVTFALTLPPERRP